MKYLLDTHVLLWWLDNRSRLPAPARKAIDSERNDIFVSAASVWEIAIKKHAGKLDAPNNLLSLLQTSRITLVAINAIHAEMAGDLPDHHADPFDRMIVAQAMEEDLTLMTHDKRLQAYGIACFMI